MLSDQNVSFHDACVENKRKHLLTEARKRKEVNFSRAGRLCSQVCCMSEYMGTFAFSPVARATPLVVLGRCSAYTEEDLKQPCGHHPLLTPSKCSGS